MNSQVGGCFASDLFSFLGQGSLHFAVETDSYAWVQLIVYSCATRYAAIGTADGSE